MGILVALPMVKELKAVRKILLMTIFLENHSLFQILIEKITGQCILEFSIYVSVFLLKEF